MIKNNSIIKSPKPDIQCQFCSSKNVQDLPTPTCLGLKGLVVVEKCPRFVDLSSHITLTCFLLGHRNIAQLTKVKIMKKCGKWENLEIPQR
jgi:hypothetical protein